MSEMTRVGVDLAKNVIQIHAVDSKDQLNDKLRDLMRASLLLIWLLLTDCRVKVARMMLIPFPHHS